jgi:alpha-ketoglutarate-dependent taurine dioxygenase
VNGAEISPLTAQFGAVVHARQSAQRLATLDVAEVKALFKSHGTLLFRGFDVSPETFEQFTNGFGGEFAVYPGQARERVSDDGRTQTVTWGNNTFRAHAEMAYSPYRPDLLWFHCVRPAMADGETTVFDGRAILEAFSPSTRALFEGRTLHYCWRDVPTELWQGFLFPELTQEELTEWLGKKPGVTLWFGEQGELNETFVSSAVRRSKYGAFSSFASSFLDFTDERVKPFRRFVEFGDGTPITRELIQEAREVTDAAEVRVAWKAGDVLMIDNDRVMHGRRAFEDEERRILVRMCEGSFA